jgi:hypothetical protein
MQMSLSDGIAWEQEFGWNGTAFKKACATPQPIGTRNTVYLTSGQTAVVIGVQLEEAGRIYFTHDGKEVASFKKEYIAGISKQ